MYIEKAAETAFVRKICMLNVDEIDYRGQFHQHFSSVFSYESALRSFSLVTFWLWRKDFGKKALLYKNARVKC